MKDSQTNIAPSQAHGSVVIDIQHAQGKNNCVVLGRLLKQVVEIVRCPLYIRRQFLSFLLLNNGWVEDDVVLGQRWNSAGVEESFHCKSSTVEGNQRAKEWLVRNEMRHDV